MTQATGGTVSPGKPHRIGEESSHCTPQPWLAVSVEATDEDIEAVAEMIRKAVRMKLAIQKAGLS